MPGVSMNEWQESQKWEADWWGSSANTIDEELKQFHYAQKMGLEWTANLKTNHVLELGDLSVIDIGGGPASMLLKANGTGLKVVADPLPVPQWVIMRYRTAGIEYLPLAGEDLQNPEVLLRSPIVGFDEAWIYNVLLHVRDPEAVCRAARRAAKLVRVYEWVDTAPSAGHPHTLTRAKLNEWLGGIGQVEAIHESGLWGNSYFGVFLGDSYHDPERPLLSPVAQNCWRQRNSPTGCDGIPCPDMEREGNLCGHPLFRFDAEEKE